MVMKYADNIVKVKTDTFNLAAYFTWKTKKLGSQLNAIKLYPVYY